MKNGEILRDLSNEQLGSFLCKALEQALEHTEVFCCDVCPVAEHCRPRGNGFEAWLNKENEETVQ